jgi:hypothetical protein
MINGFRDSPSAAALPGRVIGENERLIPGIVQTEDDPPLAHTRDRDRVLHEHSVDIGRNFQHRFDSPTVGVFLGSGREHPKTPALTSSRASRKYSLR